MDNDIDLIRRIRRLFCSFILATVLLLLIFGASEQTKRNETNK